jgi:hypothetical protein
MVLICSSTKNSFTTVPLKQFTQLAAFFHILGHTSLGSHSKFTFVLTAKLLNTFRFGVHTKRNLSEKFHIDSYLSGWRTVTGSYDHGNKLSGSIKGEEFLDYLSDYQLLKDSAQSSQLIVPM